MKTTRLILCFPDTKPGPRGTDCPSPLHDHPLPAGYIGAMDKAEWRLRNHWKNRKCKRCGLYGWTPPMIGGSR